GFKWIAKMIKDHDDLKFIGGGEESFGFMVGDFVRDKDAVTATLLACEIAAQMKADGSSFYQKLMEIYQKYGLYREDLVSMVKKGIDGAAQIKNIMVNLRENPLKEIIGEKVVLIEDYETSMAYKSSGLSGNEEELFGAGEPLDIPRSDVLIYYTENGTKVAARPSGTEPKIKFYISVNTQLDSIEEYETVNAELMEKVQKIKSELNLA